MKSILMLILLSVCNSALALDLDQYLNREGRFFFNGELKDWGHPSKVEKEDVYVDPLDVVMTRYVFRTQANPVHPEIAFMTLYKDSDGNYYSYMQDQAYLRDSDASFDGVSGQLNPNQWVPVQVKGQVFEGSFYPGDLGEIKFRFEFFQDSIRVDTWEWEQWFGMIPLPLHSVTEIKY